MNELSDGATDRKRVKHLPSVVDPTALSFPSELNSLRVGSTLLLLKGKRGKVYT